MAEKEKIYQSNKRKIEDFNIEQEKKKKPKLRYEQINCTISDIIDMDAEDRSGMTLKVRLMGKRLETNGINTSQERNTLILYFMDRSEEVCGIETCDEHAVNLYRDLKIKNNYKLTFGQGKREQAGDSVQTPPR